MSDIVPEDFDLEDALNARSTTPPEQAKRCPKCRLTNLRVKTAKPGPKRTHDTKYLCQECLHHFDDPVYGGPATTQENTADPDPDPRP